MAKTIRGFCGGCGACAPECPRGAVVEGADGYEIVASLCDECVSVEGGPICRRICPSECIVEEGSLPASLLPGGRGTPEAT
jgi:Fe-S-cluster-containing hydrogenase component 2